MRVRRAAVHALVCLAVRVYFDISYQLLAGSASGRRLLAVAGNGGGPVHGYFTVEDREALLAELAPGPEDLLLDLGCGLGGIAIDLHRQSEAEVVGVDISPAAVAAATALASQRKIDASVEFLAGDLAHPPLVGATKAYAIDSLMFVPDLVGAMRSIGEVLGPGGRLFATLLVGGSGAEERLRRAILAVTGDIERLDNVTPALAESSRARARAAAAIRGGGMRSLRGRLAMRLVLAEETMVQLLVATGHLTRWRFVVLYQRAPERDAAHIRPIKLPA